MYNPIESTSIVAKKVHFLPSCHSTNDIAAELVRNNENEEGSIVITNNQTNGRGQRGSIWLSAPGSNLTFSLILKPDFIPIIDQFILSKAISLGIVNCLKKYLENVQIKWPNDIYIADKKITGISIDNSIQGHKIASSIIGIGLNVNQNHFESDRITSMNMVLGSEFRLEDIFEQLCIEIDKSYLKLKSEEGIQQINRDYLSHLLGYKKNHLFSLNGIQKEGMVMGVSVYGMLQIKFNDETDMMEFGNKEIEWIWR